MIKTAIGLSFPLRMGQDGYFETNADTASQIRTNIKNIFLTRPGERRFNNEFGSGLHKFLFEQQDIDISKDIIVSIVQRDVDRFLNGIVINDIKVKKSKNQPDNTANQIFISIIFTYRQNTSDVEVELNTTNI
jgi:phage baseplate assembly protein W